MKNLFSSGLLRDNKSLLPFICLLLIAGLISGCVSSLDKPNADVQGAEIAQDSTMRAARELTFSVEKNLEYLIYYPKGYKASAGSSAAKEKQWPLMLALHGGIHGDPSLYNASGAGMAGRATKGEDLPFILVAPYHPERQKFWREREVMAVLEHIIKTEAIDESRIHLSGYSRGAYAAWQIAMQNPDRFASLVVVSGAAPTPYGVWIPKDLPIWAFHGENDTAIPPEETTDIAAKLKSQGNGIKVTLYPGVEHNAWDRAFSEPDLVPWIMSQQKQ